MEYRGFCGPSYTSQSPSVDAELTMNWYPETVESQSAKTRTAMYPTPGFQNFVTTTDLGGRGFCTMNGRTLAVRGGNVGEVFATQTYTTYGAVAQDSNLAMIVMNGTIGNQALISSGDNGYNLNLTTNVLTQVLTGKARMVGMIDGYGIAFDNSTGRIYLSNLDDFTTWDPTQFAVRSAAPDTWKAMIVVPPDIWLIGSLSGDVWFDAGTFPFPLEPRQGLNFKTGIIAPFSLAAPNGTPMWLSQTVEGAGIVVRAVGYAPQRVSNYAVETAIANMARTSTIADAEALVYQDQGHTFYCLTFPTAKATWVMDIETGQWHQRGIWKNDTNAYDAWTPRVHTFAFNKHLTGDRSTTKIADMDVTYGSELDGTAIRRERRFGGPFDENRQVPIRNVEVHLEAGLGTQSGQGSDPLVMWQTSDDGAKTWGNERIAQAGKIGEYKRRVRFWRMGIPRDRVNKCIVTDPIPWRIVNAYWNNDVSQAA